MRARTKPWRDGVVWKEYLQGLDSGKPTLLGISKRGDRYLRTLLVHGARSVIVRVLKRDDEKGSWLKRPLERRHVNIEHGGTSAQDCSHGVGNVGPRPGVLSELQIAACSGMKTRS